MSKENGLGDNFYVSGYNLSNDTSALSKISGSLKPIDVTGIDKSAHERIGGQRDGNISWTSFWNSTGAHVPLSTLPTGDVLVSYFHKPQIGYPAANMVAKQLNYDPQRQADGSLTETVDAQANGFGLEWGVQLTAGPRTDVAATNGAGYDSGNGFTTPAVPASTVGVLNGTSLTATVVISGGTMTNVSVNGVTVGTGAGTYTVLAGQTITMTYTVAPTWAWTLATAFGLQAYMHAFAFTGTDCTIKLQDSADNVSFADIATAAFTAVTAAPASQRIATVNTATVRRYLRVATTTSGGFTSCQFAVSFTRNLLAGQAF